MGSSEYNRPNGYSALPIADINVLSYIESLHVNDLPGYELIIQQIINLNDTLDPENPSHGESCGGDNPHLNHAIRKYSKLIMLSLMSDEDIPEPGSQDWEILQRVQNRLHCAIQFGVWRGLIRFSHQEGQPLNVIQLMEQETVLLDLTLPEVDSSTSVFLDCDWKKYLQEIKSRLNRNNPDLMMSYKWELERMYPKNPEIVTSILDAFYATVGLLERQTQIR